MHTAAGTTVPPVQFGRYYGEMLASLGDAFAEFIRDGRYIMGAPVEEFERAVCDYLGASHAVGCKSGTHALTLSLLAAGVEPGSEVVTVGNTYYATAEAIVRAHARPVFCEVDPELGLMEPDALDAVVGPRTSAVMPVHLYGYEAPLERIRALCEARGGIPIVEDCAHAFGSRVGDRFVATDSDFACFSFYPTKNLGGFGDGGMVVTRRNDVARRIRELRYYADESRTRFTPGADHARLDTLQATLLMVLLRSLDDSLAVRRRYAATYRSALSGIPGVRLPSEPAGQDAAPYMFPMFTDERERLLAHLEERGISVQVHYSTDLHRLPRFRHEGGEGLPVTERHNAQVVTLPLHPSLNDREVESVAETVADFFLHRG